MALKVYINGKLYDKQDATVSVYDHGLLYGDGVFEGIRSYSGKVFRLKEHLDRLWYSAKAIWLEIPISIASGFAINMLTNEPTNGVGWFLLIISLILLVLLRFSDIRNTVDRYLPKSRKGEANA